MAREVLTGRTAACVSCRATVDAPRGWDGPVECGRCWYARTGDFPNRTIPKAKPPSWLRDVKPPAKIDMERPLPAIGWEGVT